MAAYVIFYVESIADPLLLERYKSAARGTLAEHGGIVTVAYGRHEILEGAPLAGVVMVEFPSFEAARASYHSAGYQAAATLRQSAARAHAVLVEGLAPAASGETR